MKKIILLSIAIICITCGGTTAKPEKKTEIQESNTPYGDILGRKINMTIDLYQKTHQDLPHLYRKLNDVGYIEENRDYLYFVTSIGKLNGLTMGKKKKANYFGHINEVEQITFSFGIVSIYKVVEYDARHNEAVVKAEFTELSSAGRGLGLEVGDATTLIIKTKENSKGVVYVSPTWPRKYMNNLFE